MDTERLRGSFARRWSRKACTRAKWKGSGAASHLVVESAATGEPLSNGLIDAETIKYYIRKFRRAQGTGRVGEAKEGTKQEVINKNPYIISSKQRNYRAFKLSYFDKSAIMPRPPHFC